MSATLYVVATPLGNLEDLSARAATILREVDLIACEDTRHTRKLLNRLSISTPTSSYHEHNEKRKTEELLRLLRQGKQIALVSDAGTPLLSDPGYRLVHYCREENILVYPIPGPSAAVAALSVSGLPTDRFFFQGFLPRQAGAQKNVLREIGHLDTTLIIYLSPHRLLVTLKRIREVLGNRQAFLIREMTKIHETHYPANLEEILNRLQDEQVRGEYTLVIEGKTEETEGAVKASDLDIRAHVTGLMDLYSLSEKEAIKRASRELHLSKRGIYRIVQEHKKESS